MDKKSKIEFLNEGTEVVIIFANDKKSIEYTSKKEAYEGIQGMLKNKKITKEEFIEFSGAILEQENLPWGDDPKVGFIVVGGFPGFSFMDRMMSEDSVFIIGNSSEPETIFKMCRKGSDHGHVHLAGKGRIILPIRTKFQGLKIIRGLEMDDEITHEEFDKLSKGINESSLPKGTGSRNSGAMVN